MAVVITNETTLTFSMNGVDRSKNYVAVMQGDNVAIISANDTSFTLLKSTPFSEFTINGATFANAQEVVNALTPIVYTKQIVNSGGAIKTASTTIQFYNSIEGTTHINSDNTPLTDSTFVLDTSNAVEQGSAIIKWERQGTDISFEDDQQVPFLVNWVSSQPTQNGVHLIGLWYLGGEVYVSLAGASSSSAQDTTAPTLSNFRILANEPTRIYYDSSEPISGTTFAGFSSTQGKTFTNNSISAGNTTGHFLTVATAYTNGDGNDGIAYDGTDDIGDISTGNNQLAAFGSPTPVTVTNNVPASGAFNSAVWAIGFRRIVSSYTGNAIAVRRQSDGAVLNIGFDGNGDLNVSAIAGHCAGTHGFIQTWFNQGSMGSTGDVTNASSQPKIYDQTTGILVGGSTTRPGAYFNGSQLVSGNPIPALDYGNSYSIYVVGGQETGAGATEYSVVTFGDNIARFMMIMDASATTRAAELTNGSGGAGLQRPLDSTQIAYDTTHIKELYCDGTDVAVFDNDQAGTGVTIPTPAYTNNDIKVGANFQGQVNFQGWINEIIVMPSNLQSTRDTQYADLNGYF